MWPWGHLAVAYLCYLCLFKLRGQERQTGGTLLAVAFGSQFPDLIDKPLAWSVDILPSGRSFAHSLVTATIILALGYWIASRRDRVDVLAGFGVGYLSHIITDIGPTTIFELLQGDLSQLRWMSYLLWPLLSPPPYLHDSSFIENLLMLSFEPYMLLQVMLFSAALLIWFVSTISGADDIRQLLERHGGW